MENLDASKKRGRPRGFDPRAAAGKAAILFWKHGYEGVSVDELTAAMGITTQSFYAAFGSKLKLYEAAHAWYEAEVTGPVRDVIAGESDVVQALQKALHVSASQYTRDAFPKGCMRAMSGICVSRDGEEIARRGADLRATTMGVIKARLDQGVRDGQLLADTNTSALALYLNAVVVGMAIAAQDGTEETELTALAEIAGLALAAKSRPN